MNTEPFEERAVFKVVPPAGGEGICLGPDFHVTPDTDLGWVHQLQPERFPARRAFTRVSRKHLPAAQWMPVTLENPLCALFRVPMFGPTPETVSQNPFHLLERRPRRNVAMVIGPTPNNGVEMTNQVGLAGSVVLADTLPRLLQKHMRVFFGGSDEQPTLKLAEVLSEEVESVFDLHGAGFLRRELQAPVLQKLLDQWPDFIFQHFLGHTGNDEVIRISNEVHFGIGLPRRGERLLEQRFQSVQCQVRQRRRDNPALRSACLGREEDSIFNEPGFEPFAEYPFVYENVAEHPLVGDVVETSANVAFQNPLGAVAFAQRQETLPDGVSRTAARTKAVGVAVAGRLGDRCRCQQVQCLHGAVLHHRDAERPQFTAGFRNVNTSQWLRLIAAPSQRADGFVLGRRSAPDYSVHSRRSFALIVRHSFHGQGFAGKRAGQQPLQGFHLVPASFLSCLDDTRLQPPDIAFTLSPANLFPSVRFAGGCTRRFIRVHLLFPPVKVLPVLSSRATNWKSARLHGGVRLLLLSVPLPNGFCFLQSPLPAIP